MCLQSHASFNRLLDSLRRNARRTRHETYVVQPGFYENVYDDMPPQARVRAPRSRRTCGGGRFACVHSGMKRAALLLTPPGGGPGGLDMVVV